MQGMIQRVRGSEVREGDLIEFLGEWHRVSAVEPYTHPVVGPMAGIARSADGWGITLDDLTWHTIDR